MSKKNQDRSQYLKDYHQKNIDRLEEKFICDICGGKYKYMNKTNHFKTKKHQNILLIQKLKKENETIKEMFIGIFLKLKLHH